MHPSSIGSVSVGHQNHSLVDTMRGHIRQTVLTTQVLLTLDRVKLDFATIRGAARAKLFPDGMYKLI
jgi:hypothetical protein